MSSPRKSLQIPYASATSGATARDEIIRILKRFGCQSVGFMDEFESQSVLLAFQHRGMAVQLRASAKGWAEMYLREHPYSSRMRKTRHEHENEALAQGMIAVNSILRDWVKGQITAVECGIMSFEAVFLPHMIGADGVPVIQKMQAHGLLPAPQEVKP